MVPRVEPNRDRPHAVESAKFTEGRILPSLAPNWPGHVAQIGPNPLARDRPKLAQISGRNLHNHSPGIGSQNWGDLGQI